MPTQGDSPYDVVVIPTTRFPDFVIPLTFVMTDAFFEAWLDVVEHYDGTSIRILLEHEIGANGW